MDKNNINKKINVKRGYYKLLMSSRTYKYCIFVALVLFLYAQCLLFQWSFIGSLEPVANLCHKPFYFANYYIGKMLMPLFIACFVLITKRYWWTIIVYALTTIWVIANIMYNDFFGQLLDIPAILLAGNMEGAWSSVLALWTPLMTLFVVLFACYAILLIIFELYRKRHIRNNSKLKFDSLLFSVCFLMLLVISVVHNHRTYDSRVLISDYQMNDAKRLNIIPKLPKSLPFGVVVNTAKCSPIITRINWRVSYVNAQSILMYAAAAIVYECFRPNQTWQAILLTEDEKRQLTSYLHPVDHHLHMSYVPRRSLCIVLVESLESWPIGQTFEGKEITPNLNKIVNNEHVLYCDRMNSQIRRGQSGDGQLLVCSGLLPVEDYVACMQYRDNVYPNYAQYYPSSAIVNPWPNCWNQDTMTIRYGYKSLIEPLYGQKEKWEDDLILSKATTWMKEQDSLFCVLCITISSHIPFNSARTETFSTVHSTWNPVLVDYIRSINYTDSCIGVMWKDCMESETLSQSVLIITGDHTISHRIYNVIPDDVYRYAPDGFYIPFIMYSPDIEHKYIFDECYQMDIFPTILDANGGGEYYWQGFGINLASPKLERTQTDVNLLDISSKMIKSNFFKLYKNEK